MVSDRPADSPARILIVDDHPAIREALAIRLANTDDLRVCGEAADVQEALALAGQEHFDLAVVDITLREGNGLDLIKRLKAHQPGLRILVWSMHSEELYAERALRAGADGYITKEFAIREIVAAIRQVLSGQVYLSQQVSQQMLHQTQQKDSGPLFQSPVAELSDRELEVLRLIGQGRKLTEIALDLHLSVKTIETYALRIRQKLDLADSRQLVSFAIRRVMSGEI